MKLAAELGQQEPDGLGDAGGRRLASSTHVEEVTAPLGSGGMRSFTTAPPERAEAISAGGPRVLICNDDPRTVADAIAGAVDHDPGLDARLIGCNRRDRAAGPRDRRGSATSRRRSRRPTSRRREVQRGARQRAARPAWRAAVTLDDVGFIKLNEPFAAHLLVVLHAWACRRRRARERQLRAPSRSAISATRARGCLRRSPTRRAGDPRAS